MERKWVHPNTVTGDAATNERYLRRMYINDYFWREVKKGNHILLAAPRRVGKTSLMRDLAENCPEGFSCIYEDLEGIKSKNEFYQCLFKLMLQCLDRSKIREAKAFIAEFLKMHSIKELSTSGMKIESSEINYEKAIKNLIPELRRVKAHTVIFLDEFAEVINILKNQGQSQHAVDLLHFLRALRHEIDFKHFTLVYAGSISLEFVIKNIGRPHLINDLHQVMVEPLKDAEGTRLIRQLTKESTIQFSEDTIAYVKRKIHYLLPYYFQLMIEQIDTIAYENNQPIVTDEMVDMAFQRVLGKASNFEGWRIRLNNYQGGYFPFINDILTHAAHKGQITVYEIYNKAIDPKFNREQDYMSFVRQLLNDGYLVETTRHVYSFISPFLQQFWLNEYPIYHEQTTAIFGS